MFANIIYIIYEYFRLQPSDFSLQAKGLVAFCDSFCSSSDFKNCGLLPIIIDSFFGRFVFF